MKKIFCVIAGLMLVLVSTVLKASPWTLLSDVSYIQKGGVNAVKVDFSIPVHYVAHFPARHGEELSIILRFDKNEVKDISQLPLLESINAPDAENSPVFEVTYLTDKHQRPKLVIRFKHDVHFNVSQVMGIKSLVVFMPKEQVSLDDIGGPQVSPLDQTDADGPLPGSIPEPALAGRTDGVKFKQQYRSGRRALRKRQYKKAIQIFSALLSQPKHELTQASLELLGVARERNNQVAHAKAIYKRYLKQYPTGDDSVRVKQRLADLISEQMKPRKKLKESNSKRIGKKADSSRVVATLSQYLDYSDSAVQAPGGQRTVDTTGLDTHLSVNWRIRKGNWDIRNYFFGNYDYDTVDGETDGFEIGSFYSKIRNSRDGLYATLGRQSGSIAGVLGRFDGAYFGYQLMPQVRTNLVLGYPVDITEKTSIKTDQPMMGVNAEFNDFIKGWDFTPYYIQQKQGSIVDRRAVGMELSYFKQEQGSLFNLLDYDIEFNDWNIVLLQGQYTALKSTNINMFVDYRKSPTLQVSNAVLSEAVTVEQVLNGALGVGYDEARLRDIAADRTGQSRIITLGVSHDLSSKYHLTADISRIDYVSKIATAGVFDAPATTDKSKQTDASVLFVVDEILEPKDTLLLGVRFTHGDDFDLESYSGVYRFFYQSLYRVEPKFVYKSRKNSNGNKVIKRAPGLKMEYRAMQNLRYYMEFSLESTSGTALGSSSRNVNYYIGYSWDFL